MARKRRWLPFFAGLLTGFILFAGLATAGILVGKNQTWSLRINTHGISDRLDEAIQLTTGDMLPQYIESLKPTVPVMVEKNVSNQFGEVKFHLGGEEFLMPEEFVNQLEENYKTSMVNSVFDLLDSLALDEMEIELRQEVSTLIEQAIYAEFNSQEIDVGLVEDFVSIPIIIELVSQPGVDAFKLQLYSSVRLEQ